MRIVIPLSQSDQHLVPDFTRCLLAHGGLEDHPILIIPTETQLDAARVMYEKLVPICKACEIHVLEEEPIGGWPSAPNHHWAMATEIVGQKGDVTPWLWLEVDAAVRDGWANRLSNAFLNSGGAKFMGHIRPLPYVDQQGNPRVVPGDTYMSGVAIYDHFVGIMGSSTYIPDIQSLKSPSGRDRTDGKPFDVYLRHAFQRLGRASTDLIEDQWQTINYRVENGQLICDSVKGDHIRFPRGGIVNLNAVIIHGCKDGSLHRLSADHQIPLPSRVAPAQVQGFSAPPSPSTPSNIEIMMLEILKQNAEQQKLNAIILEKLSQGSLPQVGVADNWPGIKGPQGPRGNYAPTGEMGVNGDDDGPLALEHPATSALEKIKLALASGSKRMSEVTELTGLSKLEVLEAVDASDSGLQKNAQWISEAPKAPEPVEEPVAA